MSEKQFLKYLEPYLGVVIIGTGGLGNILYQWQSSFVIAHSLGTFIAGVADSLYFVVLILWMIPRVRYNKYLRYPQAANSFVGIPTATLILGTNIYTIWGSYISLSQVYVLIFSTWIIGIIGVDFFTLYIILRMRRMTKVSSLSENFKLAWFRAPLANLITLLVGNQVLKMTINFHPDWALIILILNALLLGIGFTLFNVFVGVIFIRMAQKPLAPLEMISFLGILLGSVGLAVCAIIDTTENVQTMNLFSGLDFFYLLAALFWGSGFWLVGIILIICLHQLQENRIPFSFGWWAFIVSLHIYTIASQKIAAHFISPLTAGYTVFLIVMLTTLWFYAFGHTVQEAVCANYN